ncbi:MAG: AIR synthase-related protein, partial [Candidatus Omnitrophica bacterium]|nr:AIR synthase-related protein [Candidatus Omnitrophota bacterium]
FVNSPIHGATFSSANLEKNIPNSVVQIGDPITEKKMLDALLIARDKELISSITDCGAGGLSSAVGELAQDCGAKIFLEKVPLKYYGLEPWEIWLSESQERMVLSANKKNFLKLKKIFDNENVGYSCIGEFTNSGKLEIFHNKDIVGDIDLKFLFSGIPGTSLRANFTYIHQPDIFPENINFQEVLIQLLSHHNIASKEAVIRQYDHEVQSHTILKPLAGIDECGPLDAIVLRPMYDSNKGIVVSCGINPYYGEIDPYMMAGCCIEESLRNLVSVGGNVEKTAFLDNFCWGNINNENILGTLVRCVKGCHDFAIKYDIPFISGKDSLNNYYTVEKDTISIPGTLLISAVSIIEDVKKIVSSDFKEPDSFIYMLGITKDEMAGSHLYKVLNMKAGNVPQPNPEITLPLMKKIRYAINKGIIKACHDCSEGGFAVALSEMIIGGGYGANVDIEKLPKQTDKKISLLFSESQGRFIVEIDKDNSDAFKKIFSGAPFYCIGNTTPDFRLNIFFDKEKIIDIDGEKIKQVWTGALKW